MKKDAEDERTKVREAARERVLEEFEKGQLGLAIAQTTGGTKSGGNPDERESYDLFSSIYVYMISVKPEVPSVNLSLIRQ
jgi:nitric oxide synthase-interacting protein